MILDDDFLHRYDKNILGKFSYIPSHIQNMEVHQINYILRVDSKLPCDMFNILCSNGPADLSLIRENIKYFRSKKLPYAFWVGFQDEPSWLEAELLKLGLVTEEMEWAMACDLDKCQAKFDVDQFKVRKVENRKELLDVIQVVSHIFPESERIAIKLFYEQSAAILLSSDSKLEFFVGYENAIPVSLASVYFDEGLASIFDVIVLPTMRGKGLGKWMTQRAMHEAKTKGIGKCILTATNDAKYLYQKLGFVDVKTMKVYHER